MKVRELLSDESKWTQGAVARDKYGMEIESVDSPDACCWCLGGALIKCYGDMDSHFEVVLDNIPKRYLTISSWNDTHSYEDVKKLVDRLDI
jgi:hypothetical protein